MMLRWLQQTGGKPLALMGGGTTMVGDPSGKDESRKLLSVEQIEANKAGIRKVFARFIAFGDGATDAAMPDNAEWLATLNYIEFLRDVGRHFSVNRMLAMDSVKLRLGREHELSFLEFNYMCLQAYDFVELNRRYGCTLQMGGSDQWGNIVTGLDLGRRMGTEQLYALTSPLITTASGAKMGKTAAGAVWLDASMLAPYDYWQFWRNSEDADVGRFLKLFTLLPLDEIARLEALGGRGDQRGEESPRQRGDRAAARARGRRSGGGDRATRPSKKARSPSCCRPSTSRRRISRRALARSPRSCAPDSSPRPAKRVARFAAAALRINDVALDDERAVIGREALQARRGQAVARPQEARAAARRLKRPPSGSTRRRGSGRPCRSGRRAPASCRRPRRRPCAGIPASSPTAD